MTDESAPAQNRMMGPSAGVGVAAPDQEAEMAPQGPQGAQPTPAPTPQELSQYVEHSQPVIVGLTHLLSMPKGSLTKKEVTDAAADIISKGGFPTPEQKQALIVNLAGLKDTDADIRADLTQMLTRLLDIRAAVFKHMRSAGLN